MSSGSRSPTRTRRRSRRSGRQSTTSRRTSSGSTTDGPPLKRLIDSLPADQREHVFAHPSTTSKRPSPYERLEFLGDSLLGFVVAEHLYERYPDFTEGDLTRVRAAVVSRRTCAEVGRELGLDTQFAARYPGEKLSGSANVIAAMVEVAIAVCYRSFGLEAVTAAIADAFAASIESAVVAPADYKTQLQEELARRGQSVRYSLVEQVGPSHDSVFTCISVIDDVQVGIGQGRSKKEAEQEAARQALEALPAIEAV